MSQANPLNRAAPRITYDDAVAAFGKPSALARALSVSRASVSEWRGKGELPEGRVWQLIALRPDRFGHLQSETPRVAV